MRSTGRVWGLVVVLASGCGGSDGSDSGAAESLSARGDCEWAIDRGPHGAYKFELYADDHVEVLCTTTSGKAMTAEWKCTVKPDAGDDIVIDRKGSALAANGPGIATVTCKVHRYDADGAEHEAKLGDVLK